MIAYLAGGEKGSVSIQIFSVAVGPLVEEGADVEEKERREEGIRSYHFRLKVPSTLPLSYSGRAVKHTYTLSANVGDKVSCSLPIVITAGSPSPASLHPVVQPCSSSSVSDCFEGFAVSKLNMTLEPDVVGSKQTHGDGFSTPRAGESKRFLHTRNTKKNEMMRFKPISSSPPSVPSVGVANNVETSLTSAILQSPSYESSLDVPAQYTIVRQASSERPQVVAIVKLGVFVTMASFLKNEGFIFLL